VRRAGLPGPGGGVPLRIVEHVEARAFEVANARRQQAFGPDDPRGSQTAHADSLIILSSYLGIAWSVGLS
jgi:hypothetical protein